MQNRAILLSTAYLAPANYFAALLSHPIVIIEAHEYFVKQSYRNRCEILGANGKQVLSIPLLNRKNKSLTKDIRIDTKTAWQMQHWRSIESAYNSSPFFEYYQDELLPLFEKKFDFLLDFNAELQETILQLLEIKLAVHYTKEYVTEFDTCWDARNHFSPKQKVENTLPPYIQVFENKFEFIPNLSILDVLFNLGNESEAYFRSLK